ncbi:stage II sporulation protein M [Labilibacter marinus]|uniref:stage II sporulation protein M n=1 Tax=Labilibacter marinus TaxID=1477105 RepID=UPI0009500110|nr:stage II sporulation protein M [Labilibacter marinus]
MEFLDFLKYGAIGISLALAILSYRLLSKEQEKDAERPAFLKSIKSYMFLTVFLSVFFGLIEVFIPSKKYSKNNTHVDNIWNKHFQEYNDSTMKQKVRRINDHINTAEVNPDEVCEQYMAQLEKCQNQLSEYDQGFYQNIIKLKKKLQSTPDSWTNLKFDTASKGETITLLKNIFISLGYDYHQLSNQQIISKYETTKSTWAEDRQAYIFNSDITELIKIYLRTYENN